eukprot:jgi/Tetstr1/435914/TSEL_024800.t1
MCSSKLLSASFVSAVPLDAYLEPRSDGPFSLSTTRAAFESCRLVSSILDVIRRHLNDNATSGGQAWAALRTSFEGGHLEYEPIIGILQVIAEHEGRAITREGDCLKLAQNYSKRIEKNHASEPSAEAQRSSGPENRKF